MPPSWLHIDHIGREVRRPRDGYWLDLRRRREPGGGFIQMVLAGALAVERDGVTTPVPAGQALLLHTGMDARYGIPADAADAATFEWLFIGGAGAQALFADLVARLGPVLPDPDGTLLGRMRALGLVAGPGRRGDPLAAAEQVHAFLVSLARRTSTGGAATAVARLQADPLRRWDVQALADETGCTRDHLGRAFRLACGKPLGSWLAGRRLEAAERLLGSTRMTAAEIARQTGFPSTQAMARALRSRHGKGPRRMRERR